jgi:hypothetical protein
VSKSKIDTAIEALRGRDASAYRRARAAYHAADIACADAGKSLAVQGAAHYRTLERHMAKILHPHRVKWHHIAPSERPNGGGDVNGSDWTTAPHMSGEVWPAPKGGKYNMQMRAHIPFSISPRDGAEFIRGVALLRAAADAMAEAGL